MLLVGLGNLLGVLAAFFLWIPNIFTMAEGGVENFAFAELLAPGNRVMTGLLGVWVLIQNQELMDLLRVVAFDDVDLIEHGEGVAEVLCCGMFLVLGNRVDGNLGTVRF